MPDWRRFILKVDIEQKLRILIGKKEIEQRINALAENINHDYCDKNPILIGTLKGGFAFFAALTLQLNFELELDFVFAHSYGKADSTSGRVDFFKNFSVDIRNRHILIVEDIVDSGLTLKFLLEDLELVTPLSVNIVTLLDKRSARKVDVPIKYVGFEIDNKFVVGYGLDLAEKYRNLPYIAVFKDESVLKQELHKGK